MELEKCELENQVWLLEEKKRLNELRCYLATEARKT